MRFVDTLDSYFNRNVSVKRGDSVIVVDDSIVCVRSSNDDGDGVGICFDFVDDGDDIVLSDPVIEGNGVVSPDDIKSMTEVIIDESRIRRKRKLKIDINDANLYRAFKYAGWKESRNNVFDKLLLITKGKESEVLLEKKI